MIKQNLKTYSDHTLIYFSDVLDAITLYYIIKKEVREEMEGNDIEFLSDDENSEEEGEKKDENGSDKGSGNSDSGSSSSSDSDDDKKKSQDSSSSSNEAAPEIKIGGLKEETQNKSNPVNQE